MSTGIPWISVLASLLVAGCATPPKSAPVDARWVACSTTLPGARCDVRVIPDANGPYACALGRFRVEPDFLELRGGRPVNIQWELPAPFALCDGDGTALKPEWASGNAQVFESYGSDGKDGARAGFEKTGTCKSFRNWRWGNATPGEIYAYEIRFRNRNNQERCTIDPWVRNG